MGKLTKVSGLGGLISDHSNEIKLRLSNFNLQMDQDNH